MHVCIVLKVLINGYRVQLKNDVICSPSFCCNVIYHAY